MCCRRHRQNHRHRQRHPRTPGTHASLALLPFPAFIPLGLAARANNVRRPLTPVPTTATDHRTHLPPQAQPSATPEPPSEPETTPSEAKPLTPPGKIRAAAPFGKVGEMQWREHEWRLDKKVVAIAEEIVELIEQADAAMQSLDNLVAASTPALDAFRIVAEHAR